MTPDDLPDAILSGTHDGQLDQIVEAVCHRRRARATTVDLISGILAGEHDSHLEPLMNAILNRGRPLRSKAAPEIAYRTLLARIYLDGETVSTEHSERARKVIGHAMRFPVADGFPLITERDLLSVPPTSTRPSPFHQAIGELCAFLNGAQTQAELESFGCFWWDRWVAAENCARFGLAPGDLGPGSYGAAFRRFPTADGRPFDQLAHLVDQIKTHPESRHHELSPWIPPYTLATPDRPRQVVVPPCHGWVHVHVNCDTREMTLTHRQRSADVPVGLAFNLIQYGALLLMLAQVTGNTPKELVYWIDDAHMYESQIPDVEAMLNTEPQNLPTVTVDATITDLLAFRAEHFTVRDYHPQLGRRRIPTPL